MKILVFSDTHLTDKFDGAKYEFLKKIINEADQVIINGDFWDGYLTTFDKFISSKWQTLFPLLKSKDTVYIYGNHDKEELANEKVNLFSNIQAKKYQIKLGKEQFVFEHGDRIIISGDKKIGQKILLYCLTRLVQFTHGLIIRSNFLSKQSQKRFFVKVSKKMAKLINIERKNEDYFFIAGHSHGQMIDYDKKYANSGFIQHGIAHYLIIEDGNVKVIWQRYR